MEKWQDPETLTLWFGIILAFVLLLVISIISLVRVSYLKIMKRNQLENELKISHQRELLENNITVQERERERIAADLHDELIGKLTAIRLTNQVSQKKEELDTLIHDSIKIARRITHDLSPPLIEMTSMSELITDLLKPWRTKLKIEFNKDIRTTYTAQTTCKVQLKRIIQEILTNIDKHAEATFIALSLRHTSNFLILKITDNGKGLNLNIAKSGLGLKNIESRVQFMNGKYKVKSELGKGTSFLIILSTPNI